MAKTKDKKDWSSDDSKGYAPAYRMLPPNPISLDKPPIKHPRGKDGAWGG